MTANAAAFTFSHDLDAQVNASHREAFAHWQASSARWNGDPDLRLRLDFQDPEDARSLRNAAAHGQDIAAGTIVGCNWTEGRWPGKRALQFRSVSDRVRLNLPGGYPQFTLAAWVQLHSLNARQSQSSLCMSQGLEIGGVHWQVLHDGSLCLGIVAEVHPHVTADYISPVVFTPDRFGQWVHLAVAFDMAAREVRFYVNGALLSRHALKRPTVPTPGMAELGNWIPSSDYRGPHPVRNFVGCIDDFSVCARALGDAEVSQLAE
ncbi:MAG: LamG domain-containing protein [Chthoniobacter sp.]